MGRCRSPRRGRTRGRRIRETGAYRRAIDLYAGELLPGDRYEEWRKPAARSCEEYSSHCWENSLGSMRSAASTGQASRC